MAMITDIRLQHFRSYTDESLELSPGVNIIVGPNASGKTNLLEAIQVICQGSSYRGHDIELVRFDQPWARLDAHTETGQRTVKLKKIEEHVSRTFEIDGRVFSRLSLPKTLPVVLFEPNHLQLLHGAPEARRGFLDDLLEQTVPGFGTLRRQYRRTLAQRNALLKKQTAKDQLFAWDVRLSELGGRLAHQRNELANDINSSIEELYRALSRSKAEVNVTYDSACAKQNYSSSLLKKLEAHTELDYARGFTSYGPHRDDLKVTLKNHLAQEAASRGETRTLLLALKVIELHLMEKVRGVKPVLLLDDVFSELDGARRRALTDFLSGYQAFITTTDADVVVQHFMDKCHIIPLS